MNELFVLLLFYGFVVIIVAMFHYSRMSIDFEGYSGEIQLKDGKPVLIRYFRQGENEE